MHRLEVVILIGEGSSGGRLELLVVLGHELGIDRDLWGCKSRRSDKLEGRVSSVLNIWSVERITRGERGRNEPDELACEPEERLLEVVVALGRDLKVAEVLLPVESDSAGLDLALLCIMRSIKSSALYPQNQSASLPPLS